MMGRMTSALFLVVVFFGCGGDDDNNVIPGPLPELTGDYAITISTTVDTCGFDLPAVDAVMHVEETGPLTATVDIPAAGECNPAEYSRTGNTLRRSGTTTLQADFGCPSGECAMKMIVATTFEFDDGSVTGTEATLMVADGGDCSCVLLPCSFNLATAGDLCNGCFDCTATAQVESAPAREGLLRLLLKEGGLLERQ